MSTTDGTPSTGGDSSTLLTLRFLYNLSLTAEARSALAEQVAGLAKALETPCTPETQNAVARTLASRFNSLSTEAELAVALGNMCDLVAAVLPNYLDGDTVVTMSEVFFVGRELTFFVEKSISNGFVALKAVDAFVSLDASSALTHRYSDWIERAEAAFKAVQRTKELRSARVRTAYVGAIDDYELYSLSVLDSESPCAHDNT